VLTTAHNVSWEVRSHGGRASFHFAPFLIDITFHPTVKAYGVWCMGVELFSDKSVAVCLERTSSLILDHYATSFVPMWEEECEEVGEEDYIYDNAAE